LSLITKKTFKKLGWDGILFYFMLIMGLVGLPILSVVILMKYT
jgi:hypothetical protein